MEKENTLRLLLCPSCSFISLMTLLFPFLLAFDSLQLKLLLRSIQATLFLDTTDLKFLLPFFLSIARKLIKVKTRKSRKGRSVL